MKSPYLLCALFSACALFGCDGFLHSVCERESLPTCEPAPDLAAPSAPSIALRHFEPRASLSRSASRSLVGLAGRQLVLTDPYPGMELRLRHYDINIGNVEPDGRVKIGKSVPTEMPSSSVVYVLKSESRYYIADRDDSIFDLDINTGKTNQVASKCRQLGKSSIRPFAHPQFDALATYCIDDGLVWLMQWSQRQIPASSLRSRVDAMSVADWGEHDLGLSLLVFGPNTVQLFASRSSSQESQFFPKLQGQLESEIFGRRLGSQPVTAAQVADANRDGLRDLVFAIGDSIAAVSYRAGSSALPAAFFGWSRDLAKLPAGETARALLLVDLDADPYPDLVLETDSSVLLYRNEAGGL